MGRWSGTLTDSGPWHAGSTLTGGLLLYGGLGWLLERWLGWPWLTPAGILLGMAAAVTSIWFRYGVERPQGAATSAVAEQPQRAPHD